MSGIPENEKKLVADYLDHAVADIEAAWAFIDKWPVEGVEPAKPPKILSFIAEPKKLPPSGGGVELAWSMQDATSALLNDVPVPTTDTAIRVLTEDTTFTLKALGDGPTDVETRTVEVGQVVDPPVEGLVPATGTSISSAMFNRTAKGDRFDSTKFPGYIPYHCFSDPQLSIIAPPADAPVKQWVRIIPGVDTGLYVPVSYLANGKIAVRRDDHATDDMEWLANQLRVDKPPVGKRNEGWPGPYITPVSHPNATTAGSTRSPPFMGLRADGLVLGMMPLGDTELLLTLDQRIKTYHDIALTDDPKVFYVTCANEGMLRKITRDKLTLVSEEDFATGMGYVSSVVWVGGMLYAADQTQHTIWKINPVTHERTVVCKTITQPSWLSETEKPNEIAVMSWADYGLYYVNTTTGVAGPNLTPVEHRTQTLFGMIDVDVTGAATGIPGLLAMGRTHDNWGGTNNAVQMYVPGKGWNPLDPDAKPMGGLARGDELFHYFWYACFHREQGLWMLGGTADIAPTYLRRALSTDPEWGPYGEVNEGFPIRHAVSQGMHAAMRGSPLGVAEDKYPSASCVINSSGSGIYNGDWFGRGCPDNLPNGDCGPRIEDATERHARRKAWIYGGFGGSYPRPEFRSVAEGGVRFGDFYTYGIGMWLLDRSQEFLVRGVDCFAEWRSVFPADMEVPWPDILHDPDYNVQQLRVEPEGAGMRVFYKNKDGQGSIPPNTTMLLYTEFGLPGQRELATVKTGDEPTEFLHWPGPIDLEPGDWIFSAVAVGLMSAASVWQV